MVDNRYSGVGYEPPIEWSDDSQDRAPMTEALDDIAKLCAKIDELETERDQWKVDAKQLQSTLRVVEEENEGGY